MINVHIPKMGMSTVEVDILDVLVAEGDTVAVGQQLVEVESEKSTFVVESEWNGTVMEVRVAAGDVREVGDVVMVIEETP